MQTSRWGDFKLLWEITAGAVPRYDPLRGPTTCDVAVVGGGFTGLSAALALAGKGARVRLLEAGPVGFRASGRNGGQVVPGLKPRADNIIEKFGTECGRRMLDFAHVAADRTFELVTRHGIDCDPTHNGWIQGAFSRKARENLRERAAVNAAHGADVAFLDEQQMAELTGSRYHHGGLIERRAGAVHPLKFARGLARAAADRGACIHEQSPVLRIEPAGTGWQLDTRNGRITAGKVILATDGYTGQLWPALHQSMVNVSSAMLATPRLPDALLKDILPARAGVSETRNITYYYRIDPSGRFVIGGRGSRTDEPQETALRAIARATAERFPQLAGTSWEFAWAGRVALTMDDVPHLHQLAPGLWTSAGYCGRGVALAVCLGEMLAELACGVHEQDVPYPVTPLRRIPLHSLREVGKAGMIMYYRIKDGLGLPS